MDWVLSFLPMGLAILAQRLKSKDANDTGADDEVARVMEEFAPVMPALIQGKVTDKTADKVMLITYEISRSYLRQRGKLPEVTDEEEE
jgi:hypothetical protein